MGELRPIEINKSDDFFKTLIFVCVVFSVFFLSSKKISYKTCVIYNWIQINLFNEI